MFKVVFISSVKFKRQKCLTESVNLKYLKINEVEADINDAVLRSRLWPLF